MSTFQIIFKDAPLTQVKFNEIEKFVLTYFQSLWTEINQSIHVLRKSGPELVKSELCLCFVGADSLSRFREIVNTGKEEKDNDERFREWIDDFVFNQRNDVYKKYSREINCTSFIAWELRNSLLHFYGLPNLENEIIGFATLDTELIRKLRIFARESHPGKQIRVINPYRLIEAMSSGLLTQLESLQKMIGGQDDASKETYARGIVRCFEIIEVEGATYLPFAKKRLEPPSGR